MSQSTGLKSSIYTGRVRHRRFSPRFHDFQYDVALFSLDLSEVDRLFRIPLLFSMRAGLLQFRRSDYLGDPSQPIDRCVRDLIMARTGTEFTGSIRLLTQIRYLGICFNPVSFYYCYDETSERLKFIVTEITNTPWNERHSYVLSCDERDASQSFKFEKDFHVSPFLPMQMIYAWNFSRPGKSINVHMENYAPDGVERVFDATMTLQQKRLSAASVAMVILSFPLLTIKTILAIYWQALLLKLKGVPFYPHPETTAVPVISPEIRRTKV